MNQHLARGSLLIQQKKFSQAEAELRHHLAGDPQDDVGHALLAMSLAALKRFDEAEREARQAVHLGPDQALSHFALASVLQDRRRFHEAESAVQEAIRLDPAEVENYALLSSLHLQRKAWRAAVDAADQGLMFDPEHVGCTNVRAIALRNLGQSEAADATVASLLQRAPADATAHANRGWAQLSEGDHRAAMESFREALRLDPGLEWARAGLINAMKARNIVFRMMLKFFLFMGRLSTRTQWALIIGLYVGMQLLRGMARANPALAPYVAIILVAYVIFVYLSWTANPLFNLLLRLDRMGRYALSREEITASNCVGLCLLTGLAGIGWSFYSGSVLGLILAAMCALLVIPVSAVFHAEVGWPRQAMTMYVIGLLLAGGAILVGATIEPEPAFVSPLVTLFFLAAILSSWVGNALATARPTR